jgi:hypothetical protein
MTAMTLASTSCSVLKPSRMAAAVASSSDRTKAARASSRWTIAPRGFGR